MPTSPRSTIVTTPTPLLSPSATGVESDGSCPYIATADFQKYEGDRVGRVALVNTTPVSCRFYFANETDQIVGEVLVQQFADPVSANNALAVAARRHPEVQSDLTVGDGAVAYRTALQGVDTWQCVVLIGNRSYTVRTRQTNTSKDSFNLARVLVTTVEAAAK